MSNIKLLNGDCYELIKTIPDKSVDLVYIDIPYLIEKGGVSNSALGKRLQKVTNTLQDISKGIDYSIFDELVRVMKYIYIYIWCSKEQILDIMKIFVDKYNCRFNLLVWCKTNAVPATGDMWLPNVEYCLVFKEKGAKRYNDGYDLKSKWYLSGTNKSDKDLYDHPTIKPYQFVKQHILHSTDEGDVVLDCFMGSGTTGVACKELGRDFIGIEIDKKYYDIAVDRINGITQRERDKINEGQMTIFEIDKGDTNDK